MPLDLGEVPTLPCDASAGMRWRATIILNTEVRIVDAGHMR